MVDLIFDLETTGLDPFSDKIVALGYSFRGGEEVLMGDEKKILKRFSKVLKGVDQIVGYNTAEFDIPFTRIRCMKHGVKISFPKTVDLAKIHPHRKRLEDWCRFLDIKRDFTLDGSQVPNLYFEGKLKMIEKHCLEDLKAAQLIWRRYKTVEG